MHDHKLYIHLTLELFRECDLEFVNVYVNTCCTSLGVTAIVLYFKQFDLTMYASIRCTITESGVEIQTGKLLRFFAVVLIVQLLLIQCIIILLCIRYSVSLHQLKYTQCLFWKRTLFVWQSGVDDQYNYKCRDSVLF